MPALSWIFGLFYEPWALREGAASLHPIGQLRERAGIRLVFDQHADLGHLRHKVAIHTCGLARYTAPLIDILDERMAWSRFLNLATRLDAILCVLVDQRRSLRAVTVITVIRRTQTFTLRPQEYER